MMTGSVAAIIGGFRPISLQEAECVRLMTRIDEKYLCPASRLPVLLEQARANFRVLEVNGIRIQGYESTYFDTPDRRMYLDHHNGRLNRCKVRIREYLSNHDRFLEVKVKDNRGHTRKDRMPFPAAGLALEDSHRAFIRKHGRIDPESLLPVLSTSFSRITLVNPDLFERVTLDLNPQWTSGNRRAGYPGVVIIEVKSAHLSSSSGFGFLLREERIRPERISKYCTGTCLLHPSIRQNRFKLKMRQLHKLNQQSSHPQHVQHPA